MAETTDRDQRTEQPTPKRLQEAREKGQVPRSRELTGAVVMVAGAAAVLLAGDHLAEGMVAIMRRGLAAAATPDSDPMQLPALLASAIVAAAVALLPLLAVVLLAALCAPLALGGWVVSVRALAPDLQRLSPAAGLRRIFGAQGLAELLKALAKVVVVGGVAAVVVHWLFGKFVALGMMPARSAIATAGGLLAIAALLMSAALLLVAAVDVPFQAWSHHRRLRMTRQELRDELRETDGRPEVKARIRALQREVARRRMMQRVPLADVVITNPTHLSVALRYDAARMRAPRVVAKGRDLIALEIRRVAREHGVPVFEAPPLARAIYALAPLDREVPSTLFVAVAQVLAYVWQVRSAGAEGWRVRRPDPRVDWEDHGR